MMADDMISNGNTPEVQRPPPADSLGAISERITNLNRRQTDFEAETRASFRSVESSMDKLASEMRSGLHNLATNLADRNKPQWQAIGVALAFASVIGGMAYWPIREQTADLKSAVALVAERMVTRDELNWRSERGAEDRARTEKDIDGIRANLVPRGEHERVWQNYDQRFVDQQRQLDEVKTAQANVYSARDVLLDMRERLDRLERERAQAWRQQAAP